MVTLKETPDGAPVRPCEPGLLVRRMGYLSGCHRQLIPQTLYLRVAFLEHALHDHHRLIH